MTLAEKKRLMAEIIADQEKGVDEIIRIANRLEKKSGAAAIEAAIKIASIGLQVQMLEAQKHVIAMSPMSKYPEGTSRSQFYGKEFSRHQLITEGNLPRLPLKASFHDGASLCPPTGVLEMVCKILEANGFERHPYGMIRQSTDCRFSWECLQKYSTVTDFQLDWPYSMPGQSQQ